MISPLTRQNGRDAPVADDIRNVRKSAVDIRQFVIRDFKSVDNHRIDMSEVFDRMSDVDPAKYDDILSGGKCYAVTERLSELRSSDHACHDRSGIQA